MNLQQSIAELENAQNTAPNANNHRAVETHRLRNTPLEALTDDDLRTLLSQRQALDIIVPLTIDKLELNPLSEAGLYKGALFEKLLELNPTYWLQHPEQNNRLVDLKAELETALTTIEEDLLPALSAFNRISG